MSDEKKLKDLEKSYEKMKEYSNMMHEQNRKRIKAGLVCLAVIPLIFLCLMFKMGSSKVIYLVLWVVSLFVIAGYLITVEYMDFTMQEKLGELGIDEEENVDTLIDLSKTSKEEDSLTEKLKKKKQEMFKDFNSDFEAEYNEEYEKEFGKIEEGEA